MATAQPAFARLGVWRPVWTVTWVIILCFARFPSTASAQTGGPALGPKVEVGATVGWGWVLGDESYRGGGASFGGDVGVRVWRRVWLGFAADYLQTKRDFSSDVHWKDETVLVFGTLSYRFMTGRVQPFAQFTLGGARVHHTSTFPTYVQAPGSPGFIIKGPDQIYEGITTATAMGAGGGVNVYVTRSMTLGCTVTVTGVAGTSNPRTIAQGVFRLGYGFGGQPGPVPPVSAPASNETQTTTPTPAQAGAQAPAVPDARGVARSLDELRLLVKVGDLVSITDLARRDHTGRITSLSPSAIEMQIDGRRQTWTESDVAQVRQRRADSLANGALWGFGIGAALPLIAATAGGAEPEDAGFVALAAGIYGGVGAAIGVGVDALIKKTIVIYARAAGSASISLQPIVTGGRRSVAMRIAF